jgi:hypothetical protein
MTLDGHMNINILMLWWTSLSMEIIPMGSHSSNSIHQISPHSLQQHLCIWILLHLHVVCVYKRMIDVLKFHDICQNYILNFIINLPHQLKLLDCVHDILDELLNIVVPWWLWHKLYHFSKCQKPPRYFNIW